MTEVVLGGAPAGNSETATTAAAQTNAATTNPQTDGGEGGDELSGTPSKTFNQQEVDEIVKRRVAKAEDRAERRVLRTLEKLQPQQSAPQQTNQPATDAKPTRAQYASDEAYIDAVTDWKLEQRDRKAAGERQKEQSKTLNEKTDGIYAEAQKLAGFDRDAFDELPLTKSMVEALIDSDNAPKLMHYMAANPAEVERISKLSAARQAAELGKLEATLPAVRRSSKAPDPSGNPAAGAGNTSVAGDRSKLPMDKYIEQRKKDGAKWAQNY